jgi:hypothetical protein
MTNWTATVFSDLTTTSPIWLVLRDAFRGGPPAGPVQVRVEQRRGTGWVPLDVPSRLTPAGNLGFPDLGRAPAAPGIPLDLRIAVTAPRTVTETAGGSAWVRRALTTWTADRPPLPAVAEIVTFYPAPDYVFGAGIPVLSGRVVAATGGPVYGARVRVTETVAGTQRVEEARAGSDGAFRLPVRWSAGQARVDAALGTASGSVTVALPAGLAARPVITIT